MRSTPATEMVASPMSTTPLFSRRSTSSRSDASDGASGWTLTRGRRARRPPPAAQRHARSRRSTPTAREATRAARRAPRRASAGARARRRRRDRSRRTRRARPRRGARAAGHSLPGAPPRAARASRGRAGARSAEPRRSRSPARCSSPRRARPRPPPPPGRPRRHAARSRRSPSRSPLRRSRRGTGDRSPVLELLGHLDHDAALLALRWRARLGGLARGLLAVLADLPQPREERLLALRVLRLADAALFELERERHQLLADRLVVGHLLLGELHDLLEAVADPGRRSGHRKRQQFEDDQGLDPRGALELQSNRDEVVRRPRPRFAERQLALVLLADVVDLRVEGLAVVAPDEERRVHDHLVADDLVRPRGDRRLAELVVDLADVGVRLVREGLLDQPAELHAREVRRRLLVRLDLGLEPPQLLVLLLDLLEHLLAVPVDLETDLELVLHLQEDVAQRVVRVLQELDRVALGLEERPEAHRHGREAVVDHDHLVHVLVCERVLARAVIDLEGSAAHDGREVAVMDRAHFAGAAAGRDRGEGG